MVRIQPSQGWYTGSNPVRVAKIKTPKGVFFILSGINRYESSSFILKSQKKGLFYFKNEGRIDKAQCKLKKVPILTYSYIKIFIAIL